MKSGNGIDIGLRRAYQTGTVVILSGMPGSGKGELALSIKETLEAAYVKVEILSASDGVLLHGAADIPFDEGKATRAESLCLELFKRRLTAPIPDRPNIIVVNNPNLSIDDVMPYYVAAQEANFDVEVMALECSLERAWACNRYRIPIKTLIYMYEKSKAIKWPETWEVSRLTMPPRFKSVAELTREDTK